MAEGDKPNKDENHEEHDELKKDMKSMQNKYKEMKENPKVQATQSLFSNFFIEIFYLIAVVISFIYSLTHSPRSAVVFIGIGFLLGIFLFSFMKNTAGLVNNLLTKQELVVHIIVAVIAIILAFIIPSIMMGILVGIPAGVGVRYGIFEAKKKHADHHDHDDHEGK